MKKLITIIFGLIISTSLFAEVKTSGDVSILCKLKEKGYVSIVYHKVDYSLIKNDDDSRTLTGVGPDSIYIPKECEVRINYKVT